MSRCSAATTIARSCLRRIVDRRVLPGRKTGIRARSTKAARVPRRPPVSFSPNTILAGRPTGSRSTRTAGRGRLSTLMISTIISPSTICRFRWSAIRPGCFRPSSSTTASSFTSSRCSPITVSLRSSPRSRLSDSLTLPAITRASRLRLRPCSPTVTRWRRAWPLRFSASACSRSARARLIPKTRIGAPRPASAARSAAAGISMPG